jgi:16S rRNA processing protein RimM
MEQPKRFFIAQVGKTHGLRGDLKLHLHTDFPEQFQVGYSFKSSIGELKISRINLKRGTVAFNGYNTIESARRLTNVKLYSSIEETRERCKLNEGEHFWFDLEGCQVVEDGETLGVVEEIQRLADVDYLSINTDRGLVEEGFSKTFLIPNIPRYVLSIDIADKTISVQDGKEILKAS